MPLWRKTWRLGCQRARNVSPLCLVLHDCLHKLCDILLQVIKNALLETRDCVLKALLDLIFDACAGALVGKSANSDHLGKEGFQPWNTVPSGLTNGRHRRVQVFVQVE